MTTATAAGTTAAAPARVRERIARAVVVVGLAVDAYVHLSMAPVMDLAAPDGIGGGNLFRLQGGAAAAVAVLLLVLPRRWTYLLSVLVGLSALVPVLLYHFVDVPPIGPVPRLYDPLWSAEKVATIVGATLVVGFGLWGARLVRHRPGPGRRQL